MRRGVISIALLIVGCVPAGAAPAQSEHPRTITERTAGIERREGWLPIYWDARKGRLLLEVPRGNEPLLYGASLAGGAGTLEARSTAVSWAIWRCVGSNGWGRGCCSGSSRPRTAAW